MGTKSIYLICVGLTACIVGMVTVVIASAASSGAGEPPRVIVLELDGAVGPASSDYIRRGIEQAEASGAMLVILRMDTPGGLDTAMRDIISSILASRVPVASYVAPPGSRAASAGTYIMYASHVAAMAPATNLGSATPVSIMPGGIGGGEQPDESDDAEKGTGSDDDADGEQEEETAPPAMRTAMERKVINDAAAYIKGLARLRGRNEKWAEAAVRSAVNLTAEDALDQGVIDHIAKDLEDLLVQLDGRKVETQSGEITLDTKDLSTLR